jgi:hypothetical protein
MDQLVTILYLPQRSPEQDKLNTALVAFKAEGTTVMKNKEGHFTYADIGEILTTIEPLLAKHGLSVTDEFIPLSNAANILRLTLRHSSGQFQESAFHMPLPDYNQKDRGKFNQQEGGSQTYFRRYIFKALLGIPEVDNDGGASSEPLLTDPQLKLVHSLLKTQPDRKTGILKHYNINSLEELTKKEATEVIETLKKDKNGSQSYSINTSDSEAL